VKRRPCRGSSQHTRPLHPTGSQAADRNGMARGHPLQGPADRSPWRAPWATPGLHALQGLSKGGASLSRAESFPRTARPSGHGGARPAAKRLTPIAPRRALPANTATKSARSTADAINAFRRAKSIRVNQSCEAAFLASGQGQLTDTLRQNQQHTCPQDESDRGSHPGAEQTLQWRRHPALVKGLNLWAMAGKLKKTPPPRRLERENIPH